MVDLSDLKRQFEEADRVSWAMYQAYAAAREIAMKAMLNQRDFNYCRQHALGIEEVDEDLNVKMFHELNDAQIMLHQTRNNYVAAKEAARALQSKLIMRQDRRNGEEP
jgi:hypothetical protein